MQPLRLVQIALFILASAVAAQMFWPRASAPTNPDAMIGKAAPALPEKFRGRVVLVNFFASWCLPCKAEQPLLQIVSQQGIAVIGIAFKDKASSLGDPYSLVMQDRDGRTAAHYGVSGVPDSFLVDPQGVIRLRVPGPLTEEILRREVLPLAEKLKT